MEDWYSGSYGYVEGNHIKYLFTRIAPSGIVVEKAFWFSRLLYPSLCLPWTRIASIAEQPHSWRDWPDDMLATIDLVSDRPLRIVVPWRSDFAKLIPDAVRYTPLGPVNAMR
jgi:hypothetical protein